MNELTQVLSSSKFKKTVGKWIAVVGGEIVTVGDDAKTVYEKAKEKYPDKEPFIAKFPKNKVMLL